MKELSMKNSSTNFTREIIKTPGVSSEVYNGVLCGSFCNTSATFSSTTIEGIILVTASWKTGKISATVEIDGKMHTFCKPNKIGDYQYEFVSKDDTTLNLNFSGNEMSGSIQGAITGDKEFLIRGSRNRFHDKKDSAYSLATALKGQYNAIVNTDLGLTGTDNDFKLPFNGKGSYFTVKVLANGSVKVTVFLSDGTTAFVNSSLVVFENDEDSSIEPSLIGIPFDIPLYSKKGSISGIFFINPEDKTISSRRIIDKTEALTRYYSDIRWQRESPEEFTAILLEAQGRAWNANEISNKHTLNFHNCDFPSFSHNGNEFPVIEKYLPNNNTASYTGKLFTVEETESKLRLSVAKTTGIISGSFTAFYQLVDAKKRKLRAVKAVISGVMINDSVSGVSAGGFISIPETDHAMEKIRKVRIIPFHTAEPLYIVVDLSAGAGAAKYPVSYLADVPDGGWTSEYKTDKIVFRKIPAGAFLMGSPDCEKDREEVETQHNVMLSKAFYMGIFEVTHRQWERVMGESGFPMYSDMEPKESVSWDMIKMENNGFMDVLNKKVAGLDFDLPTEAQWEYACRAGTGGVYNVEGAELSDLAWFGDNSGGYITKVGLLTPNAWGLYDMHGNVYEWCRDWYDESSYSADDVTDPTGATASSYRVLRGGSWCSVAWFCRSAYRRRGGPAGSSSDIGFRAIAR